MENQKFDPTNFSKDTESIIAEMTSEENGNPFPIDILPHIYKDLVINLKDCYNFSYDFSGCCLLSAVSTAIGTGAKIEVKSGWFEFPCLYMAIVGHSGLNKSHALSKIFEPIITRDSRILKEFTKDLIQFDEFENKKSGTANGPIPVLKKSILSDFTPEVLFQRLSDNPKGCTILSDELDTFMIGMNNYSKADLSSMYLSLWSSKPFFIDRLKRRIPLSILAPFVNIIGGIQPKLLDKIFNLKKIITGFLQRFLFAWPENILKDFINDNEIDRHIYEKYEKTINELFDEFPTNFNNSTDKLESKIFYWSNEAKDCFYEWNKENTRKVNDHLGNLEGEIASKFDNHCTRLALILQIMEDPKSEKVSLTSIQGAIKLSNYFYNTALKVVNQIMNPESAYDLLTDYQKQFYDALPNIFKTSEANEIGIKSDIGEKTIQRLMSNKDLFKKIKHGKYSKIFSND